MTCSSKTVRIIYFSLLIIILYFKFLLRVLLFQLFFYYCGIINNIILYVNL